MSVQRAGTDIGAFQPGAYLRTHAEHVQRWHAGKQGG